MPLNKLAIIGGSGLASLAGLEITGEMESDTPYGKPSAKLVSGSLAGTEIIFLARHGSPHTIPPHMINYRANLWALKDSGVNSVIGVNAVGGITGEMHPQKIVIPDQIIDYTWSREHTYFEEDLHQVTHVDFTHPYSASLRDRIINAAETLDLDLITNGTYGATQGPRLETAAEIRRMQKDGCNIVGMTGMPEAGLARELSLEYASISLVVNWAAGIRDELITMETIQEHLDQGMKNIMQLLGRIISGQNE